MKTVSLQCIDFNSWFNNSVKRKESGPTMNSLISHLTINYSTNYVTKMQEERIILHHTDEEGRLLRFNQLMELCHFAPKSCSCSLYNLSISSSRSFWEWGLPLELIASEMSLVLSCHQDWLLSLKILCTAHGELYIFIFWQIFTKPIQHTFINICFLSIGKGYPLHTVIASLELILHKQKWFIIMQNCNYAKLLANLHMGEEWLRGFARVEPPVPLPYANWAPEKFREMMLYASIHLPSNNYVSQQGAKMLPNTANTHTHSYTAIG